MAGRRIIVPASKTTSFEPGRRFEVVRRIGAGGMGVVYEADDLDRGARVALKTLPRLDPELLYRFKREFRNLTDISHPNLVQLYELFSVAGTWFFSMEFVEGEDFLDHVRGPEGAPPDPGPPPAQESSSVSRDPTLPLIGGSPGPSRGSGGEGGGRAAVAPLGPDGLRRLRPALRQLVEGIHALHRAGKLHRDIKPSNVLVTPEGRVVLLDFGLSVGLREQAMPTDTGRILGTLSYMAPEQALGHTLTAASDWYAVGVMLFEALSGRLPFPGSGVGVLRDKQRRDAPAIGELAPTTPPDLARLCLELLRRQPSERPDGRQILAGLTGEPAAPPAEREQEDEREGPFVGRSAQLAVLRQALTGLREGRPATVFLRGRSGAGKSYLAEHFLAAVESDPDAVVLTGRCYETESVPYKGVDSLVDALARMLSAWRDADVAELLPRDPQALLRLFPVLRQVERMAEAPERPAQATSELELRRLAFRSLRELLARLGDRRRLVLVIDDLQWSDLDSVALVSELLQPPDPPVMLLLGIYRAEYEESSQPLRRLLDSRRDAGDDAATRFVEVGPLDTEEAELLALQLLADRHPHAATLAAQIARESGGVPFFVHQLAQHALATEAAAETAAAPLRLEDVVASRVGRLPVGARKLLETVSLAGRPLRQIDAYEAAELDFSDLSSLVQLRTGHMVRSSGMGETDAIEAYHDRIRQAVVDRLPPDSLPAFHLRLARTLERTGAYDAEAMATHFDAGGEAERAAEYYGEAADQAATTLAFDHAARLYRRSLELRPLTGEAGRAMQMRLGDALANAGRGAEAAAAYQRAMEGAAADDALELQRRAALQYCISGHMREGRTAFADLLGRLGMKLPGSPLASLARMLWYRLRLRLRGLRFRRRAAESIPAPVLRRCDVVWSASHGLSMIDIIDGAAFQTRALLLALRAGETYRIARALAWEAVYTGNAGSGVWKRTRRMIRRTRELAEEVGRPHAVGMATMADGVVRFFVGRWRQGLELLEDAIATFEESCTGVAWELGTAHNFELWAVFYLGDVIDLERRMRPLLQGARDRGDLYVSTTIRVYHEPLLLLVRDRPAAARRVIHEALQQWAVEGFHLQTYAAMVLEAQCDLYEGDAVAAEARLAQGWRDTRRAQLHHSQLLRILLWHLWGEASLVAADGAASPQAFLNRARRLERRLRRQRVAWADAFATALAAGVALRTGDRSRARDLYRDAVDRLDEVEMGLYAAAARYRAADLSAAGEGASARATADRWMESQGVVAPQRMARAHVAALPATEAPRESPQ